MRQRKYAKASTPASVGPSVPQTPADSSDVEMVSDDELNFDEDADLQEQDEYDEDESDSDFEGSDIGSDDYEKVTNRQRKSPRKKKGVIVSDDDYVEDVEDVDEIMFSAGVKLSKIEATRHAFKLGGAGPSSAMGIDDASTETAAALRAAAAERRLAREQDTPGGFILPDDVTNFSVDEESALSSGDEPLSGKGKGKAKGKGKGKAGKGKGKGKTERTNNEDKHYGARIETLADKRKRRREQRLARNEDRAEERRLAKELGRRLTYAEKATLALHKHHPSLKNIWGNLEARVPVVKPEQAEQPEELKVTLLPFQRESLFWMRKQEVGEWAGGMLAVSRTLLMLIKIYS
jgi:DNA repair protein RAD16